MDASIMGMAVDDLRGPKPRKRRNNEHTVRQHERDFASAMEESTGEAFDVVVTGPHEHCERCAENKAAFDDKQEEERQAREWTGPRPIVTAAEKLYSKFEATLTESGKDIETVLAEIQAKFEKLEAKDRARFQKRRQVKRTDFEKKKPSIGEQLLLHYDGTATRAKVVTVTGMRGKEKGFVVDGHLKVNWDGSLKTEPDAMPKTACVRRDRDEVGKRVREAAISLLESCDWTRADLMTLNSAAASVTAMETRRREARKDAQKQAENEADGKDSAKRKKTKKSTTKRLK
jgi:hypothetical protein